MSPNPSNAEVVSFGHNLTATTHVLEKYQASVGGQVLAFGATEDLSIGTSTWLLLDYEMYNAYARYRITKTEDYSQSIQFGYFQTDPASLRYNMKAAWLNWMHGWHSASGYNFFLNFQVHYYIDEVKPFSMRRPRVWRDPTELVLSTLHEVPLANGFYLMGELGILGLARKHPILHTGSSLQWRSESWLVQMGYSMTAAFYALATPSQRRDLHQTLGLSNGENHGLGESFSNTIKRDFSIHPELVLQYFF